jgi:hypothetical protein
MALQTVHVGGMRCEECGIVVSGVYVLWRGMRFNIVQTLYEYEASWVFAAGLLVYTRSFDATAVVFVNLCCSRELTTIIALLPAYAADQ